MHLVYFADFNYLAESYVSSLNNGSTPSIPSIINHIVEAEFIREKESITHNYRKKMNERLVKPMSVEELDNFSAELRSEAMKRFKRHKVLQKASNTDEMEQKLTVSNVYLCSCNVSWFVHLQETWLGNIVSWFVHLQET